MEMKPNQLIIPERLIPSEIDFSDPEERENYKCHVNKYRFAALFCEGRTVLDLACGAGYGSEIIASEGNAASVVGVDRDAETIAHANRHYAARGVSFLCCGYDKLSVKEKFDVVVSINTIEYVQDPVHFVASVRQLLDDAGVFIVSTHITPTTDFNPHTRHDIPYQSAVSLLNRYGFQVTKEYLQVKNFRSSQALYLIRNKNRAGREPQPPRSLIRYYMKNPLKALKRAKSLILNGLSVKTITLYATPLSKGRSRTCR
jgi:2-polyprenyl-3-methyl-5-hydroxy-6-metoxy-1,4-benzoquinol methylase